MGQEERTAAQREAGKDDVHAKLLPHWWLATRAVGTAHSGEAALMSPSCQKGRSSLRAGWQECQR